MYPYPDLSWRREGLPSSRGSLLLQRPALYQTPVEPPRLANHGTSVLPTAGSKPAASTRTISKLNHTALQLAVYASRGDFAPLCKTRYRLMASLYRAGLSC